MPTAPRRRSSGHEPTGVAWSAEELFGRALGSYGPVRDLELAVRALTAGAPPPYGPQHLRIVVEKASEIGRLRELDAGNGIGTSGRPPRPAY